MKPTHKYEPMNIYRRIKYYRWMHCECICIFKTEIMWIKIQIIIFIYKFPKLVVSKLHTQTKVTVLFYYVNCDPDIFESYM